MTNKNLQDQQLVEAAVQEKTEKLPPYLRQERENWREALSNKEVVRALRNRSC